MKTQKNFPENISLINTTCEGNFLRHFFQNSAFFPSSCSTFNPHFFFKIIVEVKSFYLAIKKDLILAAFFIIILMFIVSNLLIH